MQWPAWWSWPLELTPHLVKRMADRDFNEVDLRLMLESATGYRESHEEGWFAVETKHNGRRWIVIVEPSNDEDILIVITAYPAA